VSLAVFDNTCDAAAFTFSVFGFRRRRLLRFAGLSRFIKMYHVMTFTTPSMFGFLPIELSLESIKRGPVKTLKVLYGVF